MQIAKGIDNILPKAVPLIQSAAENAPHLGLVTKYGSMLWSSGLAGVMIAKYYASTWVINKLTNISGYISRSMSTWGIPISTKDVFNLIRGATSVFGFAFLPLGWFDVIIEVVKASFSPNIYTTLLAWTGDHSLTKVIVNLKRQFYRLKHSHYRQRIETCDYQHLFGIPANPCNTIKDRKPLPVITVENLNSFRRASIPTHRRSIIAPAILPGSWPEQSV